MNEYMRAMGALKQAQVEISALHDQIVKAQRAFAEAEMPDYSQRALSLSAPLAAIRIRLRQLEEAAEREMD